MVPKEKQILKKVHSNNIMSTEKKRYHFPKPGSTELIHHLSSSEADRQDFSVRGIWQGQDTARLSSNGEKWRPNEKKR